MGAIFLMISAVLLFENKTTLNDVSQVQIVKISAGKVYPNLLLFKALEFQNMYRFGRHDDGCTFLGSV